MKDAKLGLMIAVPAAVALVSIVWFLRQKSGKKKEKRRKSQSDKVPQIVRDHDKPETQMQAHSSDKTNQGITLTQRKIPETNAQNNSIKHEASDAKPSSGNETRDLVSDPTPGCSRSDPRASDPQETLHAFQKIQAQKIVTSAVTAGLREAGKTLSNKSNNAVNTSNVTKSDGGKDGQETIIQESMVATTAAPIQQSVSQSLSHHCRRHNDKHLNSVSDVAPSEASHSSFSPSDPRFGVAGPGHQTEQLEDSSGSPNKLSSSLSSISVHNSSSCQSLSSSSCVYSTPQSEQSTSSCSDEDIRVTDMSNHDAASKRRVPSISSDRGDSDDSRHTMSPLKDSRVSEIGLSSSILLDASNMTEATAMLSNNSQLDSGTDTSMKSSANSLAQSVSENNCKPEPSTTSASPVCDSNSVGSNDSGRGGSEQDNNCQVNENLIHFDFNMPSELCGRLIGRQGKNINWIKSKSGASVSLSNNPFTPEFQICQVVGSQTEVDEALTMIRRKFPLTDHPKLTMTPLNIPIPTSGDLQPVIIPEGVQQNCEIIKKDSINYSLLQLSLPEGVSVDVYVSAIVSAGHVFVQQPTHRTFMSLEKLNYFLNNLYGQDSSIPSVPEPVECGVICVCENDGSWYRAMITSPVDENKECEVKFVDYGGYAQMPVVCLKQIRTDFMTLPFQAVECFMANISPLQGEEYYSVNATLALSQRTQFKLLKCQVVARSEEGVPFIHLYDVEPETNTAVMTNRTLVNDCLVRWVEIL